jgi:hypothetical protein
MTQTETERRIRQLEARLPLASSGGGASEWVPATLGNGWGDYGASTTPASYCRDLCGFVHLRGLIKRSIAGTADYALMFTLPASHRPAYESTFAVVAYNQFARLIVTAAGQVYLGAADATVDAYNFVSLDGVTFDTRA